METVTVTEELEQNQADENTLENTLDPRDLCLGGRHVRVHTNRVRGKHDEFHFNCGLPGYSLAHDDLSSFRRWLCKNLVHGNTRGRILPNPNDQSKYYKINFLLKDKTLGLFNYHINIHETKPVGLREEKEITRQNENRPYNNNRESNNNNNNNNRAARYRHNPHHTPWPMQLEKVIKEQESWKNHYEPLEQSQFWENQPPLESLKQFKLTYDLTSIKTTISV